MRKTSHPKPEHRTGKKASQLTKFVKRTAQLLLIGTALFGASWCGNAEGQERQTFREIINPHGDVVFRLDLYGLKGDGTESQYKDGNVWSDGDKNEFGNNSARDFTDDEINALVRGLTYWAEVVSWDSAPVSPVVIRAGISPDTRYNAGAWAVTSGTSTRAYSVFGRDIDPGLMNSNVPGDQIPGFHALMKFNNTPWSFNNNTQLREGVRSLESVMIHEFGHAMGISNDVTEWQKLLSGRPIEVDGDDNITRNGEQVFTGQTASLVYGDGVAIPVPMQHNSRQEVSHFGLQNGLMTHQTFRNYSAFMEVELAALQDIGYTIDRRNFFGRSYYTNNNGTLVAPVEYSDGYFKSNGVTGKGTSVVWAGYDETSANEASHGLGLHVYGNNNFIKVIDKDILSIGEAGGGIRVDGFSNTVIVDKDINVHANGENGTGLLVAFGTGHHIINQGNIQGNGTNGTGVRFDFGPMYNTVAATSYSHNIRDLNGDVVALDGALVDRFDISGSISGTNAAIYIADNAHVANINIMNNAARNNTITGDIISNYTASDNNGERYTTTLTFGKLADLNTGEATNDADTNFRFDYDGNITGSGQFDLETHGGTTKLTGNQLDSFQNGLVKSDSTLNLQGTGTVNFSNNVAVENNGYINIAQISTLDVGQEITNAGHLKANGYVEADQFHNINDGIISGAGIISTQNGLINSGTIAAGNSIDTLTVQGAYTNNTGTLVVEIDPSHYLNPPVAGTHNDLISVVEHMGQGDGIATIDGGLVDVFAPSNDKNINPTPARYVGGTQYTFLTAENGLDVQQELQSRDDIVVFDFVTGHDNTNNYWLTLKREYEYGPYGDTFNQVAVGDYIDEIGLNPDPNSDFFTVLVELDNLNKAAGIAHRSGISRAAKFSLDQMSGAIYASQTTASIQNATIVNNTLNDVLRRGDFFAKNDLKNNLWGLGYGMGGYAQFDGNAYGYNQSFGGTIVGIDRLCYGHNRLGAFFSYGEGRISSDLLERSKSKEFLAGLYLRKDMEIGYFLASGGLGNNRFDTERNISFMHRQAKNKHDALVGTAYIERGFEYEVRYGKWQPFAGLQYVGMQHDSFTEHGANSLNLVAGRTDGHSLRSGLGTRFALNEFAVRREKMSFHGNAAWMHEFLGAYTDFTAQFSNPGHANFASDARFTVHGNNTGRDWAILGTGMNFERNNLQLFAGYDLYLNSNQVLHTGNVGMSYGW